ncbi:MAG TPA: hypothetical protein VGX03_17305 [Candidatus Binatia bacterium]|jgi:hypothetical protein|nr:hypothetical protein [Candidatus Binatia bacterium]
MSTNDTSDARGESQPSCDPALTRRQFVAELVKKAALAGTLTAAPLIADAFMAPPAYAQVSTDPFTDTGGKDTGCTADTGGTDTQPGCLPNV